MSAKFFLLYGTKTLTAHVTDEAELMAWASDDSGDSGFKPALYDTIGERIAAANSILVEEYATWALFDYSPEGMADFVGVAAQKDELVGLHALELAQEYADYVQKLVALALTEAQQKAMDHVQFPIAGDKAAFQKYQERIGDIRELSIKGLTEYVDNDYKFVN